MRLPGPTIVGAQSFVDPLFDVAGSVSDVLSDSEPGWAGVLVTPGVQRGDWDAQVVGELLGGEQAVKCLHQRDRLEWACHPSVIGMPVGMFTWRQRHPLMNGVSGVMSGSVDTLLTGLLTLC